MSTLGSNRLMPTGHASHTRAWVSRSSAAGAAPETSAQARRPIAGDLRLALAAVLLILATSQVLAGGLKSLTTPQELALGQTFAEEVDRQYPMLRDPVLSWYVNLRGRQLADRSPRNDIPYFFRVIDSSEINAFAIPGGHVYVNLGDLQVADHEAELLAIMAHEVGHIVGRHGAQQIVKQQWASLALSTAIGAYPNYYAYLAGNLFGELGFLKMSRDDEREADQLGFKILIDAGYDPRLMVTMFEKLRERYKEEPSRLEKLFLTHPPTDERIANLHALLAAASLHDGLRVDTEEFQEIKRRVMELYPPPKPEEEKSKKAKDAKDKKRPEQKRRP